MPGYLFITAAAPVAAAITPGSGGYGFSLLESLNADPPAPLAGLPATYAGNPSSTRRARGPACADPAACDGDCSEPEACVIRPPYARGYGHAPPKAGTAVRRARRPRRRGRGRRKGRGRAGW